MVDPLATTALETLRDLLVDEVKFLSGVSNQVKQVERDLRTMHGLLLDADKRSSSGQESNSLRNCIIELRELASEAENVLEKYAVEVASNREGRKLKKKLKRFACILCECVSVHEVGKETEDIPSRLAHLTDELKSISGGEGSSINSGGEDERHLLRLRFAHEVEQHFVGMEKDIECLVKLVKDNERCNRPVISICGMGGLGKTTLARKIYHHEDVQGRFDARAWVCVTQQFQAGSVFREILRQFLPKEKKEEINNMGQPELVEQLHNVTRQKKCLIVIDDIWEMDHWNILKPAFPTTNCKVVLTTRNENIVAPDSVHRLDFLSEDEGWELLAKIALLPKNDDLGLQTGLRSFEDIGREMVKKCGRLPLAISVIGGILRQKQTLTEWEKVNSNIDSYLAHGEGVQRNEGVKQVLDLSYNTLPYYLKPCFLYLACFPEDQKIETERLYLLWIAEGLISSQDKGSNETLRDVAERYLSELAFRCMVQVQKDELFAPHNKFESCWLHDLMRDLCLLKAEEDNFLKRISFSKYPYNNLSSNGASISRLAICVEDDYYDDTTLSIKGIQKLEDLRSFLVLHKDQYCTGKLSVQDRTIDFDKSKCFRILLFEGCEFKGGKLPSKMDKQIHLRYLGLVESDVEELPVSICDMPYLQTLDLRVSNSIKLPNVICKLKRLRHLFLDDFNVIGGDKLILDGLKELETLVKISSERVCIADIPKLTNLRKLNVIVEDMNSVSMIADYLSNGQSQLRETHLWINYCDFSSEEGINNFKNILMSHSLVELRIFGCKISRGFPSYEQGMCRNLVILMLRDSRIGGYLMEKLGNYPMLRLLRLSSLELVETNMVCGANSFPELKFLSLWIMSNLEKWKVEERAMPKLTELHIYKCNNLEMIPDGLRFISTLQELTSYMPKKFNDRLRVVDGQAGEDYYKVSHIPSIQLENSLSSGPDYSEDDETTT